MSTWARRSLVVSLALAPVSAAQGIKLNGPLLPSRTGEVGYVRDFLVAPNGGRVVYAAAQETSVQVELYSAAFGAGAVKLSAPLAPGGDVADYSLANGRCVYRANEDEHSLFELFSVPINGSQPAVK